MLPELAIIPNIIEREHWLQSVADLLRTDLSGLRQEISKPALAARQSALASKSQSTPIPPIKPVKKNRIDLAGELILGILLHSPKLQEIIWPRLKLDTWPEGELRELYSFLNSGYTYNRFLPELGPNYFDWVIGVAKNQSSGTLAPLIEKLGMQGETHASELNAEQIRVELEAQLKILEDNFRDTRRKIIEAEIRRAEARGDKEAVSKLMREYQELR